MRGESLRGAGGAEQGRPWVGRTELLRERAFRIHILRQLYAEWMSIFLGVFTSTPVGEETKMFVLA